MNRNRRRSLAQVEALICQARNLLEEITQDEQEAYDNLPESLQEADRGQQMDEYIYTMGEIVSNLEEAEEALIEIIGG